MTTQYIQDTAYLHGMTLRNMNNPVVCRIVYMISFFPQNVYKFKTEQTNENCTHMRRALLYTHTHTHISRTCESSLGQCLLRFFFLCVLSFFFFVFPFILSYSPDLDACVFSWLAGLCSLNTMCIRVYMHTRFLLLLFFFCDETFFRLVHNLLFSSYFVEFLVLKNQREQLYHHVETM